MALKNLTSKGKANQSYSSDYNVKTFAKTRTKKHIAWLSLIGTGSGAEKGVERSAVFLLKKIYR